MGKQRNQYSGEFTAKVVIEVLKGLTACWSASRRTR
jgi:hypothetical protein